MLMITRSSDSLSVSIKSGCNMTGRWRYK